MVDAVYIFGILGRRSLHWRCQHQVADAAVFLLRIPEVSIGSLDES